MGLALAAPVGPISLLCIKRTTVQGIKIGFATGLGAAAVDALLAGLAAFGLTTALSFFTAHILQLQLAGSVILLGIAWITWQALLPPCQGRG